MATITTHRFTHPGILRALHPEILMHWLAPAFAYLEGKGIVRESEKNRIDHDRLAHLFLEPEPTMPEYLLDSAFLIQEMSDTDGMDLILEAQAKNGFTLRIPDDPTPMEVAMQAYSHQRELLLHLHHDREIRRRRSFYYFITEQRRLTPFEPPTPAQLNALQERLDVFFRAYKRGPGSRVFMYPRSAKPITNHLNPKHMTYGPEPSGHSSPLSASNGERVKGEVSIPSPSISHQLPTPNPSAAKQVDDYQLSTLNPQPPPTYYFILQHGLPCKREAAMKDGESTVVFYRPQAEDIVVYDVARDELRIHACNLREIRVLKRAFGACLFGDADYFRGEAKYTLQPLLTQGAASLACADVKGMRAVTLVQVQFQIRNSRKTFTTCRSPDAFRARERKEQIWPTDGIIKQASFMLWFQGVKKPRRLTLTPPNKLALSRDADVTLANRWLQARNFIEVSR